MLVLLAGCSAMQASLGASVSTGRGSSASSAPAPAAAASEDTEAGEPHGIPGAFVKAQLESLPGKTPDEARRLFQSWGHDGKLTIEPSKDFYPACKAGRICDWNIVGIGRAYSASVHDDVILYTQKEAPRTTAPPP